MVRLNQEVISILTSLAATVSTQQDTIKTLLELLKEHEYRIRKLEANAPSR